MPDGDMPEEQRKRTIEGVAVPYNSESLPIDGEFVEIIDPEVVIDKPASGVMLLYNHDMEHLLARERNGTLELWPEEDGLHFRAAIVETCIGDTAMELVRQRMLSGASIGFVPIEEEYEEDRSGKHGWKRVRVKRMRLHEVSVVAEPAYPHTAVDARAKELRQRFARKHSAEVGYQERIADIMADIDTADTTAADEIARIMESL